MEVNYNLPLELHCIMVDNVPTNNGVEAKIMKYKVRIMWKDIYAIEQFIRYYNLPQNTLGELTCVILNRGVTHIVTMPFQDAADDWTRYKQWASGRPDFMFNQN